MFSFYIYLIHNCSPAYNAAYITACFVRTGEFNGTENYLLMIRGEKSAKCFMLSDFIKLLPTWKWEVVAVFSATTAPLPHIPESCALQDSNRHCHNMT